MADHFIKFIQNAGGCIISVNILNRQGQLRWLVREEPVNAMDTGWRFISDIDDDEFLSNPNNSCVCDFNTMASIETAVLGVYDLPVGSDLQMVVEDGRRVFYDNLTGERLMLEPLPGPLLG